MPTEQRPPVSRRKLGLFGVVALIAARADRRHRHPGARGFRAPSCSEWTDDQAIPTVAVALPRCPRAQPHHRSAGPAGSLFARADLCARQRLSEELERRYRRAGQGRPGDRRDRGARPRPAIAAGQGRSRQPAVERAAVGGDAEPAQDAARLELRLDAGNRRAHRRPRQQEGRRQFRHRPMSSGWRRWRATRRSPCRSTAWSPRATPTSAR